MPTFTLLTNGTNTTASHTVSTTASVTPSANKLLILDVFIRASGFAADLTISAFGLTWDLVKTTRTLSGTWPLWRYRAMGPAPTAGTVSITSPVASSATMWVLTECGDVPTTGVNGADAVIQSDYLRSGSTPSVTTSLPFTNAFGNVSNGALAAFASGGSALNSTPKTGWLETVDFLIPSVCAMAQQYKTSSDTSAEVTYSSTGLTLVGIASEIAHANAVITAKRYYQSLVNG